VDLDSSAVRNQGAGGGGEWRTYKINSPIDRITDEGGFVGKFLLGGVCLLSEKTKLLSGQPPMFV